jgi:hypothetical protein
VLLAVGRGGAIESRAPFAAIAPQPRTLRWDRPGQPAIVVEPITDGWRMTAPAEGPVDPSAITDVLAAVRGARWQRTGPASPGPARFTLTIDDRALAIGEDVPGVGTWISERGSAFLVEPWVITAIDRDPLSLRVRSPFGAELARLTALRVVAPDLDLRLAGAPLAVVDGGARWPLVPDVAAAVLDHLALIRVEALVPTGAPIPAAPPLSIEVTGKATVAVTIRGPCPGDPERTWVGGAAGEVCVETAPVTKLELAARMIQAAPLAVVDPRPVPAAITDVTLASGARLHWRGAMVEVTDAGRVWPADADGVARVVAALTGPATPVLVATPRPAATGSITVDGEVLDQLARDTLARPGQPLGYRLAPDAIAALRLDATALRDRELWRTEPSLLTAVAVTGGGKVRTVAGDDAWARELAEALAEPRAVRLLATAGPIRRTIELTYAPPPAAGAEPEVHRLDVGPSTADGCSVVADGQPAVLERELCRLLMK